MTTNRSLDTLLAGSRLALTNARDEADLQAYLAPFGYDPDALAAGLALVDAATEEYQQQQTEYAEQFSATAELNEKAAAAKTTYLRHLKLARVAFKADTPGFLKLGLGGDRRKDLAGWTAQAWQFYRSLAADADLRTPLARLTVDDAAVAAAVSLLDEVEAARGKQARETAEAQIATRRRDDAVSALRGFLRDFYAVAEIATADQPQLREKLGIVVRA